MMKTRDYEAIASALRSGLTMSERWQVFLLLDPVLRDNNPRYDARKFGERLGVPLQLLNIALNKREEEKRNAEASSSIEEARTQEGAGSEEGVGVNVEDFHSL